LDPFEIKIYKDLQQGTEEWLALREGKISASQVEALMVGELGTKGQYLTIVESDKSGTFSKGAMTYLDRKVDEKRGRYYGETTKTKAMDWGNRYEDRSRLLYEEKTGRSTYEIGFAECVGYNIGVSPDGLVIDSKRLIEIKNYNTNKVNKIVESGKIPKDAFLQMQMQMLVMDCPVCDFVLTDFHREATHEYTCFEVERDDSICEVMYNKLISASEYIDEQCKIVENQETAWLFE